MQAEYSQGKTSIQRGATTLAILLALTIFAASPIEANPKADAHFKKGLQLSLQKKWALAETQYRKAIALDPKNATYRSYLADALAAQGKFEKAQDSYQQSDKIRKANPQPGYKKPTPRQPPSTRTPTARTPTARAPSTRTPNNRTPGAGSTTSKPRAPKTGTSTTTGRGGDSGKLPDFPLPHGNDGDDGKGDQETITLVTPDGRTVTVTGRPGTTITIPADDDINAGPDDADIVHDPHFLKGQEYSDEEKWPQAETAFRATLKTYPRSTQAWNALGDVCFKQGKWKDAETAHRAAARLDPEEGYFHAQLAGDLLKQGRREEARKAAMQAVRLGLEDHWVFDELGLHVNAAPIED